jgi:hypothetical protein
MTQFFYTRKEPIKGTDPLEFKTFTDSFSLGKVIRTIENEDNTRIVLLDDIHERVQDVATGKVRNGAHVMKKERGTYQTEIFLSVEDSERFVKTIAID